MILEAMYDDIKITFDIQDTFIVASAENLKEKPFGMWELYRSTGIQCEHGDDYVRLTVPSSPKMLTDRLSRIYLYLVWCFVHSGELKYSYNDLFPEVHNMWGDERFIP